MTTKKNLELVKPGFANGISKQLETKQIIKGPDSNLSADEKNSIIEAAYVNDLWAGRYEKAPEITAFPSDGYDGMVFEGGIPLTSMCSHHHQTIMGKVHVAYIPGKDSKVIGLSKLNRLVEHFARRGAIQEQLTVAIHNSINTIINDNKGVAVMIEATHNCVQCRGVKHGGASMKTSKLTGAFKNDTATRAEFYEFIRGYYG